MNFTLPPDAMTQIASTTTSLVASYAAPAYIIMGVLLAFYILERLIDAISPPPPHPTGSPDIGT